MSYVQHDPGKKVPLKSNADFWVEIDTRCYQSHRKAYMKATGQISDAENAADRAVAIADALRDLILVMGRDWNLTGEDEQKLPFTAENIDKYMLPEDVDEVAGVARETYQAAQEVAAPLGSPSEATPADTQ